MRTVDVALCASGEGESVQSKKVAALAALAVLGFGLVQGARLIDGTTGLYSADSLSIPGVAIGGVSCLVVALLSYYKDLNDIRPIVVLGVCCMGIRLLTVEFIGPSGMLSVVSQLFSGIGWMLMLVCWMQVLSVNKPGFSAPMIISGWLVALLIAPAFSSVSDSEKFPIVAILLFVSIVILVACLVFNRDIAECMKGDTAHEVPIDEVLARALRIVLLVAVASFACGFVLQGDIAAGHDYMRSSLVSVLDALIYAVLLIAFVALKPGRRVLSASFPICLAFLPAILAVKTLAPGCEQIGGALMVAFLMTLFGLFWIALSRDAYERKLPAVFLLGLAVGSAQLSVALGRAAWLALAWLGCAFSSAETAFLAVVVVAVGSSTVVAIVSFREKNTARTGEHIATAECEDAISCSSGGQSVDLTSAASPSHDDAIDLLIETYGLSTRESEVISEYSMGRSARFIADQMLLSEYTIKSHLRRAYAKLDIHSRQELLNLIELMEAKLRGMK